VSVLEAVDNAVVLLMLIVSLNLYLHCCALCINDSGLVKHAAVLCLSLVIL